MLAFDEHDWSMGDEGNVCGAMGKRHQVRARGWPWRWRGPHSDSQSMSNEVSTESLV